MERGGGGRAIAIMVSEVKGLSTSLSVSFSERVLK